MLHFLPAPLRGLLDTTVRYARGGMDLDRALNLAAQPYRMDVLKVLAVVMGVSVRIGQIEVTPGLRLLDEHAQPMALPGRAFDHFL